MDPTGSAQAPGTRGEPGERPREPGESRREPGEPRRVLERPPGDRYKEAERRVRAGTGATSQGGTASRKRALPVVRGIAAAAVGAGAIALLGGPLSVTAGLVVAAAFIGWLIASLVRPAVSLAIALSVGSVAAGLVGIWLFAGLEGGSLGLFDYLAEVQGVLVPIELATAGLVALATLR